jgi:hypothetical protein
VLKILFLFSKEIALKKQTSYPPSFLKFLMIFIIAMIFHQIDDEKCKSFLKSKRNMSDNVCFYEMFCEEQAKYGRAKCNERTS